jgi:PAS domain S-box-containing protein
MASLPARSAPAPSESEVARAALAGRARLIVARLSGAFRLGLRARLALLVVVAGLPALLLFLHHAQGVRAGLMAEAEARALRLARAWAENHDALVREAHLLLLAATRDPAAAGDRATCEAALRTLVGRVNWSSPIALFGRDGAIACGLRDEGALFARLDRGFLADLFDNPNLDVSEFTLDAQGRSVAFAGVRFPVRGRDVAPDFRVAVAVIDLAVIQQRTERDAQGAQYNIMVLDRAGVLLARAPQAAGLVGTRLSAGHPIRAALNFQLEGSAVGPGLDGVERVFAFTQMPQTGAKVAVGLARSDVVGAQLREQDWLMAALIGVAALAAAAACVVGELSVLRWIRALDRTAEAFAHGDLAQRAVLPPTASVELSRLALTFNRMAANLDARSAALGASERRFRDIAEISGDWIWERDETGRSTYLSERFSEVTGIARERLLGASLGALAELGLGGVDRLQRAFDTRQPFRDLVHRYDAADGAVQYWRISGMPIFDVDGTFRGYRGTGSNITGAIEGEVALRDAKDAAEAANRAKSQFLAAMSHELRTPLNAVIGFSELLDTGIAGRLTDKQAEYLRDIHASGRLLLAIVDDILDIAKADADRLDLSESVIDLSELVIGVVRLLADRAARGRIVVEIAIPEDARALRADERRLRQVLLNIVGNALKFTPAGGRVQVTSRIEPAGGGLVLSVVDTGIGIAAADLTRVTEPFWQSARDLNRAHEGVGLGLTVSRRIVEQHGGRLRIDSIVGVGTSVEIALPPERVAAAV